MDLNLHITDSLLSGLALLTFVIAYAFVMTEEFTHLRKSKPVVISAGIIWVIVAWYAKQMGVEHDVEAAVRHNILEFAEIFLFLLVAMTYINALENRLVFEKLRAWLLQHHLNYRQLFWVTGGIAFLLSPIADNLTTALLMCAVVIAVGRDNPKFIAIACINIVVAANAGGVFTPFGDITTLMVWQKDLVTFEQFFYLFIPALVSYLIPAVLMQFAIPPLKPTIISTEVVMRTGARRIALLFLMTIATAIIFNNYLHLPPALGMMTGLGYLNFFAYYLKKTDPAFDVFNKIKLAEWDTLFFFYGVILSVGGLATLGYLEWASETLYSDHFTRANILIGLLSAIIDNIPMMFAVLTMNPDMGLGQWLLVTLTTGIGGSLLSIGSAAGVALMGQARGFYTFTRHLVWSWAILLGYFGGVCAHLWLNQSLF